MSPSAVYGYKPYTAIVTEIGIRFKRDRILIITSLVNHLLTIYWMRLIAFYGILKSES
ncbi:MAG: hypothetical protein KME32_33490 [Mojavia pulchra JT2-VF2]|uniref:Uncharacterized protein n=1 Tax=Mojavia pulchra JT2-VF2 TaxID=287848 RepID=A0A951Q7C8_9NOST|nr:hypothetical protein [Mojavia pulchra JT2-VF2]